MLIPKIKIIHKGTSEKGPSASLHTKPQSSHTTRVCSGCGFACASHLDFFERFPEIGVFQRVHKDGFSLLEAVIALAILSIGLLAIINSESVSLKLFDYSQNNTIGAILARYKMEQFDFILTNKTFSEIQEEQQGDFKDLGYDNFTWEMKLEKDEDISKLGKLASSAGAKEGENSAADLASSFIGISPEVITKTLEDNIKKLTLTIHWEDGLDKGEITIWRHYMSKDIQGITGLGAPAPQDSGGTENTGTQQNPSPNTQPPPTGPNPPAPQNPPGGQQQPPPANPQGEGQ